MKYEVDCVKIVSLSWTEFFSFFKLARADLAVAFSLSAMSDLAAGFRSVLILSDYLRSSRQVIETITM